MGINTNRIKITCFISVGLLTAFAGILQATRVAGSYSLQGQGMELEAIAATVIGGTSLLGGVGTILGTLFGIMLLQFLNAGLLVMRVPAYWYQAFVGALIVGAVVINMAIEKRGKR
jgi:ribose/xylose/arabinose/galactoside ABC-type transport system permease subunit